MPTRTSGPVTVVRTTLDEARAIERQEGTRCFGWDAWARKWVRVSIEAPGATPADLLKAGAVRCNYGHPDPPGVCRVWSVAAIPDHQARSNVDLLVMRPAGFERVAELDTSHMELLEAATYAAKWSLCKEWDAAAGRWKSEGLANWCKTMPSDAFAREYGGERCG